MGHGKNTNMQVYASYRIFKHKYLGGNHRRRVDTYLIIFMKYNQDCVFADVLTAKNVRLAILCNEC